MRSPFTHVESCYVLTSRFASKLPLKAAICFLHSLYIDGGFTQYTGMDSCMPGTHQVAQSRCLQATRLLCVW